jgi:hypothetical protein
MPLIPSRTKLDPDSSNIPMMTTEFLAYENHQKTTPWRAGGKAHVWEKLECD